MTTEQPRLYDHTDLSWIATIVDHVVDATGEPWRALRERVEHTPISTARANAILAALRRVLGGRAQRTAVAQRLRERVLGQPALDDTSRDARLDAVASSLGLARDELLSLLWIDLAEERPVTLPDGRPDERRLAAIANCDRIQHLVRRAHTIRLRIAGDAHALIRTIKRYGLLATVTTAGDATVLDVLGPLSLFHATTVYGRALAQLVPLLADLPRFELEATCDLGHGTTLVHVASPILLPPVPLPRGKPTLATRLVRALEKALPDARITLDPPPIAHRTDRLYPELLVEHLDRRTWIDLVGFATADYLASRLARYHAAGITDVLLCVDDARAEAAPPVESPSILRYAKRLDAAALATRLSP